LYEVCIEVIESDASKAGHPVKQRVKLRVEHVGALGKEAIQASAGVLQVDFLAIHTERHITGADRDIKAIQKLMKIGISTLIENNKAGINSCASIGAILYFDGRRDNCFFQTG